MKFVGISKTFSTIGEAQYKTIGDFWDEMSAKYGRANLRGLGYNWGENSIDYVIGLKDDVDLKLEDSNIVVELPDEGWTYESGRTEKLGDMYAIIYATSRLLYEIEMFDDEGNCEIAYIRDI